MEVFEYGDKKAPIILVQPVDEHFLDAIEKEREIICENVKDNFMVAAFKVNDWNYDLSPWQAPAVFGKEGFGGGAKALLRDILEYCADSSKTYIIGGYSLAGLFALWAVYQTDLFKGVAGVSPSMWFPGFDDYMLANELKCKNVYLSLGDKEEKAKNPVMATVGDKIRSAHSLLQKQHINCILEWNEGNHFRDADLRTAKGFSWVMNNIG